MSLRGTPKEQRALLDRLRPMARKIARRRAHLGRLLTFDECWEVAESALHDALLSWDPERGEIEAHVHATVDHALLDLIALRRRRESAPVIVALRGMYAHTRTMRERGDVLHDTDEDTLRQLCDVHEELLGVFGVRRAIAADEDHATREHRAAVQEALKELGTYAAQIVWMRFAEEKKLEEIAAATGTSLSTVRRDVEKAAQRLHALLKRRGHGPTLGEEDTRPVEDVILPAP
ncbi:MAG: sigma-70 family RNA polymerase sigma factor [Polyangiaceae bacterium]